MPDTTDRRNGPGGSEQVRIVRRYLSALDIQRPGRGPKRATEAITNRLLKIDELLVSADPISRLHLTQERIDLDAELVRLSNGHEVDIAELQDAFVRVARPYSERMGLTYAAWRQVGVDAEVLEKAGIVRHRPPPRPDQAAAAAASAKKTTAKKAAPAKKAPVRKPAAKKAAAKKA